MNLIVIAALAAVCGAAKLDRTYLPPASAQTAGGSPGALQTPFGGASFRSQGNQGLGGIPKGAYSNDFGGVVVDAAAAGTRAAGPDETGLGAPRPSYGSQASKVGDAAFRGAPVAGFRQFPNAPQGDEDSANAATNGNPSSRFRGGNGSQGSRFQASSVASVGNQPSRFDRPSFSAEPVEAERPNAEKERTAEILRYSSDVGTDNYRYSFETDNGISAEENGVTTNGVQAQGGFSYTGDDGQTYSVTYTADENGYQPKGDHLPTPPPIPEAILKSLELNAKEEAAGLSDDGSYDSQKYNAGSDYNESDNNNGRYNGGQSNKGSENGAIASAEAVSGSFAPQNFGNNRQGNNFNQQTSPQKGQTSNGFGNNNRFSQSNSPEAENTSGTNAFGVASQSSGGPSGGFGQSFQGSFSQQKQGQVSGFGGQTTGNTNTYQQSQSQGTGFGANSNNYNQQSQQQVSGFNGQSGNTGFKKFGQQTQNTDFDAQSSGDLSQGQAATNSYGQQVSQTSSFSGQLTGNKIFENNQQKQPNIGFGTQSQDSTLKFDVESAQSQVSGFGSQPAQKQVSGFTGQSKSQAEYNTKFEQTQSPGFGIQSAQSQASFGTQSSNTGNFGQQSQGQSGFGSQKYGYLPPILNADNKRPQGLQGSKGPETSYFNSQFQSSAQKFTETTNQLRPTKQPEITLTTPLEDSKFGSAPQQASNQNSQFTQSQPVSKFQSTQASAQVQQPQSTFSRRPSIQANVFGQFSQKGGVRPQSQGYRQQNIPVGNVPVKPQNSASAFASFNRQESVAPTKDYNNDDYEQTTGVAYTDTTPTTEIPAQLNQAPQSPINLGSQFNQAQNQFNQNKPNQYAASTQKPFSQKSYAQQQSSNVQDDSYSYKQPLKPFGAPEGQNNFQGPASGQFEQVTERPTFNTQSSAQFASSQQNQFSSRPSFQNQQFSTKYPRPPTLPAVDPTLAVNTETEIPQTTFQGQFNTGVTQASASSFASNVPSSQFNGGNTQRFPQRQQSSQYNSQQSQSFSRPQSQSFAQQTTAIPASFNQQNQYDQSGSGFNQFSGSQTFGQRFPSNQQSLSQEPTDEPTTETPASTYDGELYEYNKPAEVLPAPSQDPTPQGSEETPVQSEIKEPEQSFQSQGQFQRNQPSPVFGQDVDERSMFSQKSSQFAGASASFKSYDDSASSVAGKGEVFGGPRQPPSYDDETGYHY